MYYAYKCLPKKCGNNPLSLAVLGFAVTTFVGMCVSHGIYAKSYSFTLGILVGTQCWLWPAGETQLLGRCPENVNQEWDCIMKCRVLYAVGQLGAGR